MGAGENTILECEEASHQPGLSSVEWFCRCFFDESNYFGNDDGGVDEDGCEEASHQPGLSSVERFCRLMMMVMMLIMKIMIIMMAKGTTDPMHIVL